LALGYIRIREKRLQNTIRLPVLKKRTPDRKMSAASTPFIQWLGSIQLGYYRRSMAMASMLLLLLIVSVAVVVYEPVAKSIVNYWRREQANSSVDLNPPDFFNADGIDGGVSSFGFDFSGLFSGGSMTGGFSGINFNGGNVGSSNSSPSRPNTFSSTFNALGFVSFSRPTPSPPTKSPPTPSSSPPPPPPPAPKPPTASPIKSPTKAPTRLPTKQPSRSPTKKPSSSPTKSPIPTVYYARDVNPSGLEPFPSTQSNAKRAEFLQLFNTAISSPEETFDNVVINDPEDFVVLDFPTIGLVTMDGFFNTIHVRNPPFGPTLEIEPFNPPWSIQFPIPVVAVGFYIIDFEAPFHVTIRAELNGEPATTFVIPTTTPSSGAPLVENLAYIGLVHLAGFDYLEFIEVDDTIDIDNFSVFQLSELR
jgi:hypothetical protein